MRLARRFKGLVSLPALSLTALLLPLSPEAATRNQAEAAYRALPPQPAGSTTQGTVGVERTAVDLAAWLHAVPLAAGAGPDCPYEDLRVSWSEPSSGAGHGAYVAPLGPAPTDATTAVNGIVVCTTSEYGYMGFQARYAGGRWDVVGVPAQDDDTRTPVAEPEPEPAPAPKNEGPATSLDGRRFGAAIEDPAAYEPQRTCDATAKVGTVALKNLLLTTYPGSRNLGIGTACDGTVSEHHEGRALDFGVRTTVPAEKAMAEDFLNKVLATDQNGNQFALARRMGIMYMIWDNRIWGAYRAEEGWREYRGASPHTDHIHISMSWAGALGRTSFWSGNVAQVLSALNPPPGGGGGGQSAAAKPKPTSPPTTGRDVTIDTQLAADREARRQAHQRPTSTTTIDPTTTTWTWRRPPSSTTAPTTSTTWRPRPPTTTTTWRPPTTTTSTTVRPTTTTSTTARPATTTTSTTARPATTTTSTTARPATTTVRVTTTTTTVRATTTTTTTTTTTAAGH